MTLNIASIKQRLRTDEAEKLKPYLDCCGKYWRLCACEEKGKLTVGIGRNLDDDGITTAESDFLLTNDITSTIHDLDMFLPWWKNLSGARQEALIDMCFNIGIHRLMGFQEMLKALRTGDYATASQESLNSLWARQVGQRAQRIAAQLLSG